MKILIIDEDPTEFLLTQQMLSAKFPEADFIEISDRSKYQEIMTQSDFDLVITEYKLGWTDGLQLFSEINRRFPCVPVYMLTAFGNENVAADAIKKGMTDYIVKSNRASLADAIAEYIRRIADKKGCQTSESDILYCEKWDLAISRLTSDYAYSMRILPGGKPVFEWVTEPFKKFLSEYGPTANASKTRQRNYELTIHPEDNTIVQSRNEKLLAGDEITSEYRVITKQGDIRYFSDHALPIRDWRIGQVVRIYGAIQDITWRRNAEDKMRLMQRAIDCSNNGIVITGLADTDHAIIYANDAFLKMTGYSLNELMGKNCRILQRNERDQPGLEHLRKALNDDVDGYAILRNYRKDGSLFWNEVYISPIRDNRGKITHYIGVQNDVTQRCEMQASLTKSEAKLRAIFENVFDAVLIIDEQGVIENANPPAEKLFGYPASIMVGLAIHDMLVDEKNNRADIQLDYLLSDAKTSSVRRKEIYARKRNGAIFPISLGISEFTVDRRFFIAAIHDLTENKRAEKALRTSEERYRTLFENSVEAIFVNRGGDRIEQVNQACLKLWKADRPEELLAKHPLKLFHPDYHELIKARIHHSMADNAINPFIEEKIVRLDGTFADVLVSTVPFTDEKGPMIFFVILDITEQKRAEAELKTRKKQYQDLSNHLELIREEERARIAREIHDELGSFLTVLKMDLSWLDKRLSPDSGKYQEKIGVMNRQIEEAIQAVKKIITDLRPSILDHLGLLPAIEWLAENFQQRSDADCVLTIPKVDLRLDPDRSTAVFRIAQEALTNIIQHAAASRVSIVIEIKDQNMLMTISDNGRGGTLQQSLLNGGFGIRGMQERARYFAGELTIQSKPEAGTVIHLTLPIKPTGSKNSHD
ncbi:PAS domain S-box protein [Methylotuvimicrobium sp. KM1]|uniref:PAS domain S-box protein n=1 Tax=Methylotuvimicrobium sp. KM1 TaxID=3377707 RepID=UPI00384EAA0A